MKKRIFALLLAVCLLAAAVLPVHAEAFTPEEQYEALCATAALIREFGLDSSSLDDPLGRVLPGSPSKEEVIARLAADPELYARLMTEMLSAYDSHTMYVPAGSYEQTFYTTSSYVGVGMTLQPHPLGALVSELHPRGGAAGAGVLRGDVITAVDGVSVKGYTVTSVSQLLRGDAGTQVAVTVLRGQDEKRFTLTRSELTTLCYYGTPLEENIFYMHWSAVMNDGSYLLFLRDLNTMGDTEQKCLILDLRGNPGGDLELAFSIITDLLPERVVFFSTATRDPKTDELDVRYQLSDGAGRAFRHIYILTDEGSASAAEIITASLCDTGYATSIGSHTHGKARGQYHIPLPDGSTVVLTTMKLMSLRQGDYEGVGLAPDVPSQRVYVPSEETITVPADVALAPYSCSDNGELLNRALVALGCLPRLPEKPYQVGDETLAALKDLRARYYLTDPAPGAGIPTIQLVNLLLQQQGQGSYLRDDPLQTAIELARELLAAPAEVPAA